MVKDKVVPWETVGIGDEISVTEKVGDVELTTRGTVQVIEYMGRMKVFSTGQRMIIFSAEVGSSYSKKRVVVMHRKHVPETQQELAGVQ